LSIIYPFYLPVHHPFVWQHPWIISIQFPPLPDSQRCSPTPSDWLAVLSTTDMSSLAAAKEAGPPLPTMSCLSNRNGDDHGAWLGERRGRRHQHFGLAGPVDRGPYVWSIEARDAEGRWEDGSLSNRWAGGPSHASRSLSVGNILAPLLFLADGKGLRSEDARAWTGGQDMSTTISGITTSTSTWRRNTNNIGNGVIERWVASPRGPTPRFWKCLVV
jgi:hypothetical protein